MDYKIHKSEAKFIKIISKLVAKLHKYRILFMFKDKLTFLGLD